MATTTYPALPPPPSGAGKNWQSAYKAYQADPQAGYAAYYSFLSQGNTGKALLAQGTYPAPPGQTGGSTNSTGQTQNPPALPITNAGIPGLPGPTPAPQPIVEPGYTGPDSRFGSYNLNPYVVGAGYAPPQASASSFPAPGGVPAPAPAPAPSPAPVPSPAPQPVPAPAPGGLPGGPPSGQPGSAGGQGGGAGGNAGGAQQADGFRGGNGGFGGQGGNGGFSSQAAPGGNPNQSINTGVPGLLDIGWGNNLLSAAATAAPFPYGTALSALQAGGRAYNTLGPISDARAAQGLPALDFGQTLGSVLGLNNYGTLGGNNTVANPDQFTSRINDVIAQRYAPNGTTLFGPANTYAPGSVAETNMGTPYSSGPGGLLGLLFGGKDVPAWSYGNTNAFLGGPGSMGTTAPADPSSGAGMSASKAGHSKFNAAGQRVTYDAAGNITGGVGTGGQPGTMQTGMGGNGFSGNLSAGIGNAVSAGGTGGLQNGFGGGGYAQGGYVGRQPQVATTKDGKRKVYWPEEDWTATYGDPTDTPGAPTKQPGVGQRVSFADGGAVGGVPMMTGVEGGWPIRTNPGSLKVNISGSGHSKKARQRQQVAAQPQLSESDLLNMAELARHQQPQQQPALGGVPQLAGAAPGSGDLYRRGGFVPGRPDNITDNRPINANEGEFVIRNSAARVLGPHILNALNDPRLAFHFRSLLEQHFGGR